MNGRERWLTNRNQHAYVSTNLGALLWLVLLPVVGVSRLVWHSFVRAGSLPTEDVAGPRGTGSGFECAEPVSAQLDEAGIWPPGHVILERRFVGARCLRALPRPALTLAATSRQGVLNGGE